MMKMLAFVFVMPLVVMVQVDTAHRVTPADRTKQYNPPNRKAEQHDTIKTPHRKHHPHPISRKDTLH